jgi:hypothetical protein
VFHGDASPTFSMSSRQRDFWGDVSPPPLFGETRGDAGGRGEMRLPKVGEESP